MSGLFGDAKLLASIADEWDRRPRAKRPGSIRYFQMDEACTLDGEFRHWQEAEPRCQGFANGEGHRVELRRLSARECNVGGTDGVRGRAQANGSRTPTPSAIAR